MTKIFLVDDEPLVLIGMQGMLNWAELGYTVVGTARNGAEALKAIGETYPDIVVSDIRMPVMDGLAATQAIRELPRPDSAVVPILAMSANAFDEDKKLAYGAGMSGYIVKPIDVQVLIQELERLEKQ